ncbi:hypothetical protein L210DRAFT_3493772 [Boletus edulis BED1]|uniref:Uncharacterized protein n=1 Tax=Boletus edulis BED1 TaxID=1328754 RepID=A0AAD4BC02_BOLED|nr:hypothetical protein L210DRAFT_3493772 [Boletus edulis BED1]
MHMNSFVSTILSSILSRRSMVAPTLPLDKSNFTLDTSGVAGVFGGDEAVSAMATIHVYENRRWLGWYNSPGSYQIAKRYGLLAKSRFFDGFFPGVHTDPATLFELDGWKGSKFRAANSGTVIEQTGHLAALFMKECASLEGKNVEGRKTQAIGVTIAELNHVPAPQMCPKRINAYSPIFASIPISVSIGTCVACGVFEDWYCFSLILLGILTSGISCLVIGSGKFIFTHPDPAKGSPPGDGILSSDKEIILLKGAEGAVNSITRGRFSLSFASEPAYRNIGWCSVLLTIQFITQLLLIPQGSLFGQIMFVASLAVSWGYNSWLSSLDKEKIQRDILLNSVLEKPVLTKYTLGTRTAMVIFSLLVLQPEEPAKILDELLPNDTKVWRQWKETIVRRLLNKEKLEFADANWELTGFSQQENSLLETLYGDAQAAYGGYVQYAASK